MKKLHYAWIVCFAGILMVICNLGLCSNILSVYLPYIEAQGISNSAGSLILTVRCFSSFAFTLIIGKYYEKLSLKNGISVGSLCAMASYLIYAFAGSRIVMYYIGAALGGAAYALGAMFPASLLMNRWFHTNTGLAVGLCSAGSGLTTVIFAPICTSLFENYGLRTTFIIVFFFETACSLLIRAIVIDDPKTKGLDPLGYGEDSGKKARSSKGCLEMTPGLLALTAWMMLFSGGASLSGSGHFSILIRSTGYTPAVAAAAVSLTGLCLTVSKLSYGAICDRIGSKKSTVIFFLIHIPTYFLFMLLDGKNVLFVYFPIILLGLTGAFFNVGPSLWSADWVKEEDYSRMLKWTQIFYNLGGILITPLPGMIADRTGEYKSSYVIMGSTLIICLVLFMSIYKKAEKASQS